MGPQAPAPAATPLNANPNLPYGTGQAASDTRLTSNILSFLPTQQAQTARTNPADTSILPNINYNPTVFTAPTASAPNVNSFIGNPAGYASAVQAAQSALGASESSVLGQAQGQEEQFAGKYGNLSPVYQQLASEYNIPGYQQDVVTLQGLLQNLNQDVNAQSTLGGGLMTNSARDELYAIRQDPLQKALSNAEQELQSGQSNVANLLDTYEKTYSNLFAPLQQNVEMLPTEFGQQNELFGQGAQAGQSAIATLIDQALRKQQIAAEQEQASAAMKQANILAGAGQTPVLGGTGGQKTAAASYGLKVQGKPSAGYYFEDANGNPINAIQYAQSTGVSPLAVVTAMANSGDNGARQLVNELNSQKNVMDPETALLKYYGSF